jgi:transcriptional regulator with XRE-family HTH domain
MTNKQNESSQPDTLGSFINRERTRLGLSQRQLAAEAKVHHSKIARLESGETNGTLQPAHLQQIANALGVDVTRLLKYRGVTPRPELPSVRTYFRRKLGVNADEAEILANLVAEHQRSTRANRDQEVGPWIG